MTLTPNKEDVKTVCNCGCGCTCGCSKQPQIGDSREPATALPKTDDHGFVIHGPEIGHRPDGQNSHE